MARRAKQAATAAMPGMPNAVGYDVNRFAGRYALGRNLPAVACKDGFSFNRVGSGDMRVLGGACSEVLAGSNLAALLKDGYDLEVRAMEALKKDMPAEVLSVHTSAGVPPELGNFLIALERHIPTDSDDWCVNLQAEGASAVHAAIDMGLQLFQGGADFSRADARNRVACGMSSYHGPASTSPGGATPLGAIAKGLTHPVRYPVPSPFLRRRGESDKGFHARLIEEFNAYLDTYQHELGVLLVEPQWGSSVAAMPWPPALLREYIAAAKARGIAVVADEVMCGLGRHGAEPGPAGTGCFLSECWDLQPDIITFGKAIGGGAGHLLSGAILLHSASKLRAQSRTAFQSHTYAGSSARALANGAALLNSLEKWRPSVRALGAAIEPILSELNVAAGGAMMAHGQGGLWGGLFTHADPNQRTAANLAFKKRCLEKRVLPYFVPVGGFMLTPRYDDEPATYAAAVREMAECALATVEEMGWEPSMLLPLEAPAAPPPPLARVPLAPSAAIVGASEALGQLLVEQTSLAARELAVAPLAVAFTYRSAAEWRRGVAKAREAGLETEHIAALAQGLPPAFSATKESAIYAVVADLLEHKRVAPQTYAAGVGALSEKGVAELVASVGYHVSRALTANTFDVTDADAAPWEADATLSRDGV